MIENFIELIDIEDIIQTNEYKNTIDISVDEDQSFVLSSGVVSHNSAVSAFRKFRDPMTQAAFPLRGKFLNVAGVPATKILANKEVQSILNAVGLRMGEEAKNLRYGKILIYSDADPDGDSIAGLLINFFGRFWPELFEKKIICRVMTPLVVATNKKARLSFYTNAEFVQWESSLGSKTKEWNISYKKGLAALEDEDYSEIIKNPRLFALSQGTNLKKSLEDWFGDDATPRKMKIMGVKTMQELNDAIAS